MKSFPRGSQWRRWDLQVHTPASALNNQFGDDWDNYFKTLVKTAYEKKIYAIGVTDYFTIEGYKKLHEDYLSKPTKVQALLGNDQEVLAHFGEMIFLPNVEFRLNRLVGTSRINFHVIFSNSVSIADIEENFLRALEFDYMGTPQGNHERRQVSRHNIEALGQRLKQEHSEFASKSNFVVGLENAIVSDQEILKILKEKASLFEGNYLVGVPADEDLSEISWDSQDHLTRKLLIQASDFLFACNPKTVSWALGKKHTSVAQFKEEFKSVKPCLHGSDCHGFSNFLAPSENRFLWIKADVTFEGLKQVLFEPESRVRIQENRPDEKLEYLVIDKARFIPQSTHNWFSPETIPLNPNLNTIIGGKSSGKSLLLFHIAKCVNPGVVNATYSTAELPYEFGGEIDYDFEVTWSDGVSNRLSQDPSSRQRRLTYIPQMYINGLVEDQNRSTFHDLIQETLLENEAFKPTFERFLQAKQLIAKEIDALIVDLFGHIQAKVNAEDSAKKTGDRQALTNQMGLLQAEMAKIKAEASLSDDQLKKFSDLETARKAKQSELDELIYLDGRFGELKRGLKETSGPAIKRLIGDRLTAVRDNSPYAGSFLKEAQKIVSGLQEDLDAFFSQQLDLKFVEVSKIETAIKGAKEFLITNEAQLKPFLEKVKNKERLNELQKSLTDVSKLIVTLDGLDAARTEAEKSIATSTAAIWAKHEALRSIYEEIIRSITESKVDKITDDITLMAGIVFKEKEFSDAVLGQVDRRNVKAMIPEHYDDDAGIKGVDSPTVQKKLFEGIMQGTLKLRAGTNRTEVVRKLLADYLTLRFNLRHKGDEIAKMSPGKRGLVVLQLILHLSNAKDPILIDQPEDNLDNRTIFDELTSFIKKKRSERQIIMVTHNANLVVAADAEDVVVANQSGEVAGNENRQYRFEYVSGSLENSFKNSSAQGMLFKKGVREHVCEILEGGEEAFRTRQRKYSFRN